MAKVRFSMKNQTQKGRFSKNFLDQKGRFSKLRRCTDSTLGRFLILQLAGFRLVIWRFLGVCPHAVKTINRIK